MSDQKLGQVLEKLYLHCRGHVFILIIMKLGQDVCLNEFVDEFENGSCVLMKLCQNVCLDEISKHSKKGHVGSKTRSVSQMLEKLFSML